MKEIDVKHFKKIGGQIEWLNKKLKSYGGELVDDMDNPMGVNGKTLQEVFSNTYGLKIKIDNTKEYKQINIYFSQPYFGGSYTYYYKAVIVPNKVIFCFEGEIEDLMRKFGEEFGYELFIYNKLPKKYQEDGRFRDDSIYYNMEELVGNPLKILKQYIEDENLQKP